MDTERLIMAIMIGLSTLGWVHRSISHLKTHHKGGFDPVSVADYVIELRGHLRRIETNLDNQFLRLKDLEKLVHDDT